MPWQLEVLGETFREDECTLEELEDLEDRTDIVAPALGGVMKMRAKTLRAACACLMANRLGMSYDDALAKVSSLKRRDVVLTEYDDDLPSEYDDGFPPSAVEPTTVS